MPSRIPKIVVIGAGVGGLSAAALLAHAGCAVTVLERAASVGGKMREATGSGRPIDSGPTVLTMRWAFESLFKAAGSELDDFIQLDPLHILARHAWDDGTRFDLTADESANADAIASIAGPTEARGYRAFLRQAREVYATLRAPFLEASKPNPLQLASRVGLGRLDALFAIRPFERLWPALGAHFKDQRLRQLFGRYATYCGASPFQAPATLMLIAAVEQEGVWAVRGGMQRMAEALAALAERNGAEIRCSAPVASINNRGGVMAGVTLADGRPIPADIVICNASPDALAAGAFGPQARRGAPRSPRDARSLSALTWTLEAHAEGFPLVRHNIFFSNDYAAEFQDLGAGRLPQQPTVYVCAQDQLNQHEPLQADRLLVLVNAPPRGDARALSEEELDRCQTTMQTRLRRSGLRLTPIAPPTITTPTDFEALFPATGGALYGRASHGWAATFQRPGAVTPIPGLFLAGGATHPGPGAPMAALSGIQAARAALAHLASTPRFRPGVMPGGTSTPPATTTTTP